MGDKRRISKGDEGEAEIEARTAALARFIVWAEREAVGIGASDCAICLQLARVALQSKIPTIE